MCVIIFLFVLIRMNSKNESSKCSKTSILYLFGIFSYKWLFFFLKEVAQANTLTQRTTNANEASNNIISYKGWIEIPVFLRKFWTILITSTTPRGRGTQGKWPTGRVALKGMHFAVYQVHCKGQVSLTCMYDFNIVNPTD